MHTSLVHLSTEKYNEIYYDFSKSKNSPHIMEVQKLSRENDTKDVDAHETRNSPKNSLTLQHSFPVELDYFYKQPPNTKHAQLQ